VVYLIQKKMQNTQSKKQPANNSSSLFANHSRNELIPIINKNNEQLVDARQLHEFLKVGRDFSNWIKFRIEEYSFKEGLDFVKFDSPNLSISKRGGDRRSIDYHLTLDMAKELAMIERNAQGRQIRQYFIACEKKLRQVVAKVDVPLINRMAKDIDKVIKPIKINGRKLYDYRKCQAYLGFCTKTSTGAVRKRYDGQLVIFDQKSYVSESYLEVMISRANTRNLEACAKAASPVLPLGFGNLNLL
jgi:phage anti-repressor protein